MPMFDNGLEGEVLCIETALFAHSCLATERENRNLRASERASERGSEVK